MSPRGVTSELTQAKASLRRRITRRRVANAVLTERAMQPLVWIDFAWAAWRGHRSRAGK